MLWPTRHEPPCLPSHFKAQRPEPPFELPSVTVSGIDIPLAGALNCRPPGCGDDDGADEMASKASPPVWPKQRLTVSAHGRFTAMAQTPAALMRRIRLLHLQGSIACCTREAHRPFHLFAFSLFWPCRRFTLQAQAANDPADLGKRHFDISAFRHFDKRRYF